MKIGINEVLIYDHPSGAQQREMGILPELLRQIAERGWQCIVYVSRDIKPPLLDCLLGGSSCEVVRTPLPAIPTYKRILYGIPYWRKQVKKDNLSLFHTAYYPSPTLDIPVVFTAHDVRFMHMKKTYTRGRTFFLKTCVPYTFRKVSRILTVSQDTKNDLINFWGISGDIIDVSYNAIAPQYAEGADQDTLRRVRQQYDLPEQYILCVSHLEPRKNLRRLLKAYVSLSSRHDIAHHLVIMGKPIFGFESLFEEVQESDLTGRIQFTGYVDEKDITSIYRQADVLAFPSLHEGFGMPAIEAMACGLPVVASNVSALPEVCGDAAVFIDPYDVGSIEDGVLRVLRDDQVRQDLIKKGYKRSKQFDAAGSARAIIDSYQKALGRATSSRK